MDEKWLVIPGYSRYKISEDCKIMNIKRNRMVKDSKNARATGLFYHLIRDGDSARSSLSAARLIYCASMGINPKDIGKNFFFSFDGNSPCFKNVIIRGSEDLNARASQLNKEQRTPKKDYYDQSIRFCEAVKNNDVKAIYKIIQENEFGIKKYLAYYANSNAIDSMYTELIDDFVIGVLDDRYRATAVMPYVCKKIRNMARTKKNKKFIEFNDGINYSNQV